MKTFARFLIPLLMTGLSIQASAAEKYALLIGVTKYNHARMNSSPLKFPEDDATAVADLLKQAGYTITVLRGKAATKGAIETALRQFSKEGNADGVVLIGMFGHGVQYGEDGYFCPFDTTTRDVTDIQKQTVRDRNGQIMQEPDPDSMISMRSVLDAINRSPAKNKVILADCCREDPSAARGRNAFGSNLTTKDLPAGTVAVFACSRNEQAFEHDDWKHGAFTRAFLDQVIPLAAQGSVGAGTLTEKIIPTVQSMVSEKTMGRSKQTVTYINSGFVDLQIRLPEGTDLITNSIGMKLKLIPADEFMMGSNASRGDLEADGFELPDDFNNSDEQPAHRVRITKPFYMGIHEVTRGQFAAFVNDTGYQTEADKDGKGGFGVDAVGNTAQKPEYTWKDNGMSQTDSHPVVNVSWNDAVEFIKWLSKKEGKQYRLPTEAEWEYCCRAGSGTNFSTGDSLASLKGFGNMSDASFRGKYTSVTDQGFPFDDGFVYTSPVGRFKANGFGLYDMHGNVWEWCQDVYNVGEYASRSGTTVDPISTSGSEYRVLRGGSWADYSGNARSAYRIRLSPDYRNYGSGFRVVR